MRLVSTFVMTLVVIVASVVTPTLRTNRVRSPTKVRAAEPTPAADLPKAAPGLRPGRDGVVVLPATGLRVLVPRPDRAVTEVFGRFVPALAGVVDGRPEVGDMISVGVGEGGLGPGGLALSVSFDPRGCEPFRVLEGVTRDVSPCAPLPGAPSAPKPVGRCHAVTRWDRLEQGGLDDAGGPADGGLHGAVWCAGGLLVQAVQRPEDIHERARLAGWLDALGRALASPPSPRPPLSPVLVDADGGRDARLLPVTQRFYLLAARREFATTAPVHRVETMPGDRLCAAPPAEGAPDEAQPPESRMDGAIAFADCFALVIPSALGLSVRVAATQGACPELPARPAGWPRAEAWGPPSDQASDGPRVVPLSWRPDALDLCLPVAGGVALKLAVRSAVAPSSDLPPSGRPAPDPASPSRSDPGGSLARPALWWAALAPFLRDLATAKP